MRGRMITKGVVGEEGMNGRTGRQKDEWKPVVFDRPYYFANLKSKKKNEINNTLVRRKLEGLKRHWLSQYNLSAQSRRGECQGQQARLLSTGGRHSFSSSFHGLLEEALTF